jgi:hypothetical protein
LAGFGGNKMILKKSELDESVDSPDSRIFDLACVGYFFHIFVITSSNTHVLLRQHPPARMMHLLSNQM